MKVLARVHLLLPRDAWEEALSLDPANGWAPRFVLSRRARLIRDAAEKSCTGQLRQHLGDDKAPVVFTYETDQDVVRCPGMGRLTAAVYG